MFETTKPEHAAVIRQIEDSLKELSIGGIILYEKLQGMAIGCNLKTSHRHLLVKAKENAEKHLGCIYETVRGVGIKRLAPSSAPEVGLTAVRRCRSAAKRGKKRLDRINANSLTESEQRRVVGYSAMLGAISMIADGRKASAIAVVADPAKPIPPQNILEMFQGKN